MTTTTSPLPDLETNNLNFGEGFAQLSNGLLQLERPQTATQTASSEPADVIDLAAGAGDVELHVNNTVFKTHKYQLDKFSVLNNLIQSAGRSGNPRSMPVIRVERDERGVEDFDNTFKILYTSVIYYGTFTFDAPIIISALRISSVYDFPDLRAFSIEHLEDDVLNPVDRIQLAREFQLVSWEKRVYEELSMRKEAITKEEARALGTDALWEVTTMREKKREIGSAGKEVQRKAKRDAETEEARKLQNFFRSLGQQ